MRDQDFPGVRWNGHWVAPDVPEFEIDPTSVGSDLPPAGFSRSQFRRVFDLDEVPGRLPLRVSADSRYVLWVNGTEIGRGPIRSQPRRLRYDSYDIADHLRPGRNGVAVLVTYDGHADSFWQPVATSGVMGRVALFVLEARRAPTGWSSMNRGARNAPGPGVLWPQLREVAGCVAMRWKLALNAFAITFADGWPQEKPADEDRQKHCSCYRRLR
jgi:hypothetical protein